MLRVFGVIKNISLFGYIIRTFIVGIIAFFVGRYISKRTVNQLTSYDFVLVWILGALTVAPLLDGEISFTYIIVPLLTLFFWHYIFTFISLRDRKLSLFFNGKPIILIDDGKIIRKNLKKHFINIDLLMSELRLKNIFDISEVKYVILEPNGHFSIIKKESNRPITPTDFNLFAKPVNLPLVIINDGKLFEENLIKSGVNKEWLITNLSMYNVDDIKNIYFATMDSSKKLYIAKKD
jgi:Predicted membrane protein